LEGGRELLGHRLGAYRLNVLALMFGIGGAEELLGELHHLRLVLRRHPEQRHHHVQRETQGPVIEEVDLAACGELLELLDVVVRLDAADGS